MTHYLTTLEKAIDKTHPQLGRVIVASLVCLKAKKLILLVSPRGCGKSTTTSYLANQLPDPLTIDRLSIAGLTYFQDRLTNFEGCIVVDDIAKSQTGYARTATMTTIAELIYSHYCVSHLSRSHFEIKNFNGSAAINVQPVILRDLIKADEWEASIQDKSVRYYHLYRPQAPNPNLPDVPLEWGIEFNDVEYPNMASKPANTLCSIVQVQWGYSRLYQHVADLLKATAALDNRTTVKPIDYRLLEHILRPLAIEELVMDKRFLEGDRSFDNTTLALLTQYVSYGHVSLDMLSRDYKISVGHCHRIMGERRNDWVLCAKNPPTYRPSDRFQARLAEVGL